MSITKKSILDELNSVVSERNKLDVVATRGNHIIKSAINLIQLIEENFDDSQALDLQRRLVNSIKGRKPERFAKGVQIVKESKNEGPQILKKYLEYAEKGELTDLERRTSGSTENAFEESIKEALTNRGYIVDAQVGSGGYSIDLAIRDPNDKSRYILAVECDGKAYHSSYSARANDRLRQEVLEAKGWTFFRIWSTDWNRDPILELNQLDNLVKKLSISNG